MERHLSVHNSMHPSNQPEGESEFENLRSELHPDALRIIDEEISKYEMALIKYKKKFKALANEIESLQEQKDCGIGLTNDQEISLKTQTDLLFKMIRNS